jgi:hypothetical protein
MLLQKVSIVYVYKFFTQLSLYILIYILSLKQNKKSIVKHLYRKKAAFYRMKKQLFYDFIKLYWPSLSV